MQSKGRWEYIQCMEAQPELRLDPTSHIKATVQTRRYGTYFIRPATFKAVLSYLAVPS